MKVPRTRNTFCPTCRKHTEHKVVEGKRKTRGTAHPLSFGGRIRPKKRGRLGTGNNGRYSKPAGGKMHKKKQSKKTDFRFLCNKCKKMHHKQSSFRAKKIEFQ